VAPSAAAVIPGQDPILVNITGPLAAKLGEKVSFEVELVNRSGRPLTGLRVVDYFDRGFHHEASASPIEQRGTIDMAAGTSRRLTLDFLTDEPGRQCHRVEILDQAHTFMGGATECVLVTAPTAAVAAAPAVPTTPAPVPTAAPVAPPLPVPTPVAPPTSVVVPAPIVVPAPVATSIPPAVAIPPRQPMAAPAAASFELDMTGPSMLQDGDVGEFSATVRNTGNAPSGPTTLEFKWDPIYTPENGSGGYVLGTNSVSWDLPTIQPRGAEKRQIVLRAKVPPGARAGQDSRGKVMGVLSQTGGSVLVADESFVLIRSKTQALRTPREAGLRLSLADCDDPVQDGGATRVIGTVTNNGLSDSGRLRLVVNLPEKARVVGDPVPSRVSMEGRTLTFDSINSIPPGGHATFEITYKLPAGVRSVGTAVATLSGDELEGRTESECATTFLGP